MAYSTFHNHTTFCDGANTPEEMVKAALALGMPSIGFSSHSYTFFDESYCMQKADISAYLAEIKQLKIAYEGSIRILCGIEQDFCSAEPTDAYDFVIGAVHYIEKDGKRLDIDNTFEEQTHDVSLYYGGDYLAYAEDYYAQTEKLIERTGCTFVGHFDLVTKFNEGNRLFDSNSERYRNAATKACRSLCRQGAIFEINTGAMAKGYRSTPYPAPFLLDVIAQEGRPVILSADAHSTDKLQYALAEAETLAKTHGLDIIYEL
ncbi:MAG: histidinol-phosphatase [Coriobacteriia bacterium]|nr:histidinol-phosphatase [Coriobacteriia bacterium]